MNPNVKIGDGFVSQLLESGGFQKLGIKISEEVEETTEDALEEGKKKKKSGKQDAGEPGDTATESTIHSCPLCESELDEDLSDETLVEHALSMAELFESFSITEEDEEDEDEYEDEDEDEDEEEDEE